MPEGTDQTNSDVVAAIRSFEEEVVLLRSAKVGGTRDAFWGVALGTVVGVLLIVLDAVVLLAIVGMGLDSPLSNQSAAFAH